MGNFVEGLVGLLVWIVANGVYLDMRRRGRRSFMRVVAFFLGLPATWLTLVLVRPGSQPDIAPPPDDEEALLREVRRDRVLRQGPGESDELPEPREAPPPLPGDDPGKEQEG